MMGLNELAARCHEAAVSKGFYENPPSLLEQMALVHCEVSEVVEAERIGDTRIRIEATGKPEGVPVELADILIRVLDVCAHRKIDIEEAIRLKLEYNKTRSYKHGKLL